ncbi:MAG: type I-C CRISPR-associated protein Cas8c/Csd1, partial [Firmicutes bacterium]|nr:type I-C CRISPR-associated protein Cas8c/Csd1 [Bacillota bacterium]
MLNELAAYAHEHRSLEPGFTSKTARWAIWLSREGRLIDVLDLHMQEGDRRFAQSPDLQQGELIAGGVTRSHFLIDTAQVVALYGVEKLADAERRKALAKHDFFIELLRNAAVECPVLGGCAAFLRSEENLRAVQERLVAAKAKPTDKLTFRVDTGF